MRNSVNEIFTLAYSPVQASVADSSVNSKPDIKMGISFSKTLNGLTAEVPNIPPTRTAKLTELYEWLVEGCSDDPIWAEKAAFLYGCEYIESPLLNVSEWPTIRIAATGEIYTPEKAAYFKQITDLFHERRVELYKNELSKGTPPLEIIDKIFNYNETLPEDFQRMSGWL